MCMIVEYLHLKMHSKVAAFTDASVMCSCVATLIVTLSTTSEHLYIWLFFKMKFISCSPFSFFSHHICHSLQSWGVYMHF